MTQLVRPSRSNTTERLGFESRAAINANCKKSLGDRMERIRKERKKKRVELHPSNFNRTTMLYHSFEGCNCDRVLGETVRPSNHMPLYGILAVRRQRWVVVLHKGKCFVFLLKM